MTAIICLAENDYWKGVCALTNATFKHNFKATIFVGYRGELPLWLLQIPKVNETYIVSTDLKIHPILLDTQRHLGFEKVFFIDYLIDSFDLSKFYFFDADCIPITDYSFFENWSRNHIAICEDECFSVLHENHPWKIYWKNILITEGFVNLSFNHPYINSGFLSLSKVHFQLIKRWKKLTLKLEKEGLNTNQFNKNPVSPIQGDQEILNMALMTFDSSELSVIGREAMGFKDPVYLMVHCTSSEKPWSKNYIYEFLKNGIAVSKSEKIFTNYLNLKFKCLKDSKLKITKVNIKLTSLLTRLF